MKTLIEMKKVYCFNRFVLFVMVLSLATTFTSCSNDDDEDIPVYSLKELEAVASSCARGRQVWPLPALWRKVRSRAASSRWAQSPSMW